MLVNKISLGTTVEDMKGQDMRMTLEEKSLRRRLLFRLWRKIDTISLPLERTRISEPVPGPVEPVQAFMLQDTFVFAPHAT